MLPWAQEHLQGECRLSFGPLYLPRALVAGIQALAFGSPCALVQEASYLMTLDSLERNGKMITSWVDVHA